MGFFSDIAQEARRGLAQQSAQPVRTAPVPFPPAVPDPEPAQAETYVPEPIAPAPKAPARTETPEPVAPAPETPTEPPEKQPEPPQERPIIDLTPDSGAADDAARRKAHEAAEAKRKAEFDARQAEKRAKRQAELDKLAALSDDDVSRLSAHRVAADTERLTRRNMKEAVAEHIQAKCREDAAFARLVMDPVKSMVHCFKYINRQAQAYAEQEMKDNGIQRTGVYGLDVPDGLVFQWAEDYFNDPDAQEDHVNEEKFVPKPYTPSAGKASRPKAEKKKSEKKKPAAEKTKAAAPVLEQMSLM